MTHILTNVRSSPRRLVSNTNTACNQRLPSETTLVVPPIFALVLGILLPLNTLTNVSDEMYHLGRLAIGLTLSVPLVLLVARLGLRKRIGRLAFSFIACFAVLLLLYYPRGGDSGREWVPFVQVALVAGFFGGCAACAWATRSLIVLGWISRIWLFVSLVAWIWHWCPIPYAAWYENPNANGAILAYVLVLSVFALRPSTAFIDGLVVAAWMVATSVQIAATMSRAATMAVVVSIAVYIAWPSIIRTKTRYMSALFLLLSSIGVLIAMQTVLVDDIYNHGYYELSHELTGKNFGTRTKVWQATGAVILERPLFGHGSETDIGRALDMDLSSHSLYLQVALQVGFVGLAALLTLFCLIWNTLWQGRHDPVVRRVGAFFMGMLLHQAFTVSLTQNNLALGVIAWLVTAIGVSRSLSLPKCSSTFRRRGSRSSLSNVWPRRVYRQSVA